MTDLIRWFDEIDAGQTAVVGGKGANLGELARLGVPVPPGFVVTADAYRRFLDGAGLWPRIEALLADADPQAVQRLQLIAQEVKALILGAPMPPDLRDAVVAAYERLDGGPVAVRSSATAEDLPQASFAGQQRTFLNVVGTEHVVHAVQGCWASLFEPQAIAYRQQQGFAHRDVAIAVVVQRMVEAERSGVVFTVHPVTRDHGQLVIEAVWGLGEAAVSGEVTPDMYVVDKASLAVVERVVAEQDRELVGQPGAGGSEDSVWRDVPPERQDQAKLSDDEVATLARLALQVEAHYGRPQDIEWAMVGSDVYLLQARPVTGV